MGDRLLFNAIPIYGLLIALAMGVGVFLCGKEEKRLGLPKDISLDFALVVLPSAVIGARLYYVAFQWEMYAGDPLRILRIWEGGLAIYGGVIGGGIAAFVFAKVRKLPFASFADMVAPSLILGQAIGRWGNYFNQEAFGRLVENPAWQFFPFAVQVEGEWHMATFFYESLWDFLGFIFLRLIRKKITTRGSLFLLYLCWYGAGRFVIEGLRTDSLMLGSIRVSQALSAVLVAVASCMLLVRGKKRREETAGTGKMGS